MSKLDELKTLVAKQFENAEDKETIEGLAKINNTIDEAKTEEQSLIDRNAELIRSYKDLVQHTSIKATPTNIATTSVNASVPTFEEALQAFINKE